MNKLIPIAAIAVAVLLALTYFMTAEASGNHNITINNYYESPEPVDPSITSLTITNGISASDLARGIATAAAVNHPFDFATFDWQAGVNGAFYDDEDAVSFGLGKRFKKVDALWHGSYTQNGSESLYTMGAVFRF